jgi:hypothetical protein
MKHKLSPTPVEFARAFSRPHKPDDRKRLKLFATVGAAIVSCLSFWVTALSAQPPQNPATAASIWQYQMHPDRLQIVLKGETVAQFVFIDQNISRPYFANLKLAGGTQVTRNHPPIAGVDAMDHDKMHPGLWLGFGDISGNDFWRNKARMEHIRFSVEPEVQGNQLSFSTDCRLLAQDGQPLCLLNNHFTLTQRPGGWLLTWNATLHADSQSIRLGDQEEMGFGARVATAFAEKNGGRILNSNGLQTASQTWGQTAAWCDYSGGSGDHQGGITLMASPKNFRDSWWHNRDYGVVVANPFGREAMKQGEKSSIEVSKGHSLKLCFGALIHDGQSVDFVAEYSAFVENR